MKEQSCTLTSPLIKLKYGNTNTYLIGSLLVDTDMPGTLPALWRELKKNDVSSKCIKYVFATHYHPDHIGLVGELMQNGVKLVLLEHQIEYAHSSDAIFARDKHLPFVPIDEKNSVIISAKNSRTFLAGIGIEGEIVVTKSHSPDGAALILDDGNAFVGDLEPREFLGGYENNKELREDWDTILSRNIKAIHYGHANDQQIKSHI